MAIEFVLPQIGASAQPGKIVSWFVSEGEHVREGEPLYEVEVAGSSTQVQAPGTGTVRINAGIDRTYEAGSILGVIE